MKSVVVALVSIFFLFPAFGSETVEGAKKDLATFKEKMSVKLDETEKDLAALREKAGQKKDAAYEKTVTTYEKTSAKLKQDLNELQADAKGTWKSAKEKLSKSIDSLNTKVQKSLKD